MIYRITVLNSPELQSVWTQHKAVPALPPCALAPDSLAETADPDL